MAQPILVQASKILFVDLIGGILGFPFWWYSRGLAKFARFVWRWFNDYKDWLGVSVWVKNIFVPMYGSYDIAGRLISFGVRVVMILVRSIALVILILFAIAMMLVYLVLPAVVTLMILYHLLGGAISLSF